MEGKWIPEARNWLQIIILILFLICLKSEKYAYTLKLDILKLKKKKWVNKKVGWLRKVVVYAIQVSSAGLTSVEMDSVCCSSLKSPNRCCIHVISLVLALYSSKHSSEYNWGWKRVSRSVFRSGMSWPCHLKPSVHNSQDNAGFFSPFSSAPLPSPSFFQHSFYLNSWNKGGVCFSKPFFFGRQCRFYCKLVN